MRYERNPPGMRRRSDIIKLGAQLFIILILLSTSVIQLYSQVIPYFHKKGENGEIESLTELMSSYNVSGLSLVVYKESRLDTTITLGMRDREKGLPVDKATLFNVGGMSASLYQFLALKAASHGKIDLDAPILDYMSSWKFPAKGWMKKDPVTTRDILLVKRRFSVGYKSGGQKQGGKIYNLSEILNGDAEGPALKVTKQNNKKGFYSYGGYLILRSMLQDVYGKPIEEIIEEEIFQPLGMKHSVFTPALKSKTSANTAIGYRQDGKPVEGGHYDYPILCSGGLWTTPQDYGRFVTAIFQAAKGEDNIMLTQELAIQATTEQHDSRCLIFNKSFDLFWGGASQGYYTNFAGKPENGTIIIVFTNSDINWKFTNEVMELCWEFSRRQYF